MPTLPLMTPTPHADAWRRVAAPGGYESWRFDASSDDGKLHLVAALHFGHALDPQYLRRYALYRRFPTRVRPPVPADFCAVTFALLERGRPALRFSAPAAATPEDFNASDDGTTVRLGASHMNRGGDGVLRLHLRGTYYDRTITVNLAFRPQLHGTCEIDLAPAPGGRHGWVVVDPLCDVDGEISLFVGESAGPPRVTPFAGIGCHDHRFGTRPLGELAGRWVSGRALFEDRAILFQQVGDACFVCRARIHHASPRVSNDELKSSGSGTSRWGIGYPEMIELPGDVRLMRPRVMASSLASVIIAYDAVGDLETGRALVEVIKPRRLLWASR